MNQVQGLYYAFGQLAYAVAAADGKIDATERNMLHDQLVKLANSHGVEFDYSEIIFRLLEHDHIDVKTAYEWAMKEMKLNEYYLTEKRKEDFISILTKIAEANPPVTINEQMLIDRFTEDISKLKGDPIFTS